MSEQHDSTPEHTSYLSADEVVAAQALHQRAPYAICNISTGFFSLARHYGGMSYGGCHYVYMPGHDECVRDDVLQLVEKLRKQAIQKAVGQLSMVRSELNLNEEQK